MPFISRQSLDRLTDNETQWKLELESSRQVLEENVIKHKELLRRYRILEHEHQELKLAAGLHGFDVIRLPEVPAIPSRVVMRKTKEIKKNA